MTSGKMIFKFKDLSKQAKQNAMKVYARDFYDAEIEDLNVKELNNLLSVDRIDDNYDIDGNFINEDNSEN